MSGFTQGGSGDNSSKAASAPATPTAAPAITSKPVPAPTQPAVTPAPESPPKPLTFSSGSHAKIQTTLKEQTTESPASDASEQPKPEPEQESAQEDPKPESTEKDKEGDDFIKKFVEYLMKLIKFQLEEEESKKSKGASFGSSLAGSDSQQEQNNEDTKKFTSPRPKPSDKSMEEELKELLEKFSGSTIKDSLGDKRLNLDSQKEQFNVLKDFATAFSPNNNNDPQTTEEQNKAQANLKGTIGEGHVNAINKLAQNDSGFKENLGQFAQNLGDFLKNPTIKNGIGVLISALKIANPLTKAMSGVGGGVLKQQQSVDSENAAEQDDSQAKLPEAPEGSDKKRTKSQKSPFARPSTPRPRPPSAGTSS